LHKRTINERAKERTFRGYKSGISTLEISRIIEIILFYHTCILVKLWITQNPEDGPRYLPKAGVQAGRHRTLLPPKLLVGSLGRWAGCRLSGVAPVLEKGQQTSSSGEPVAVREFWALGVFHIDKEV